jgi:hypothetical protein
LVPLKNLGVRGQICAGCHVGGPDQEVNHDLIAAGHPRLNFEFSAYQAIYPRHWPVLSGNPSRPGDRDRYPDLEARSWVVGQMASAQAALKLLESRATDVGRPWPEFADYNCYTCHKGLSGDRPPSLSRRPGTLPWGSWYLSTAETAAAVSGIEAVPLKGLIDSLRMRLESPRANREQVAEEARTLAERIGLQLSRLETMPTIEPREIRRVMKSLADRGAPRAGTMSWEEASQVYLALAALSQALEDQAVQGLPESLRREIRELRQVLRNTIPKGFESPRLFNSGARDRVEMRLQSISRQLDTAE